MQDARNKMQDTVHCNDGELIPKQEPVFILHAPGHFST